MRDVQLPPWACWMLIQSAHFRQILDQAYQENIYLHRLLTEIRTVALEWRAEQTDTESEPMDAVHVAASVGITTAAIRKAAREGRIEGVKTGKRGDWTFTREAVKAFALTRER